MALNADFLDLEAILAKGAAVRRMVEALACKPRSYERTDDVTQTP